MGAKTKKTTKGTLVIEPLDDRVVVKPFQPVERTPGGIVLPDMAKEKPHRGEIVAIGPGRQLDSGERAPVSVAVGDTVLYGKYSGNEVKIADEDHLIMREGDILARVQD